MAATKKSERKPKKNIQTGSVAIKATFNNTLIVISDTEGNTLVTGSPAKVGFKGSKKSTAFAATKAAKEAALEAIKRHNLKEVKVYIKGAGAGRNAAVKGLDSAGLRVTTLVDRTGIPHNGCRPRKKPRK